MLNEVRFASPWLHRPSHDPETFSQEEWQDLAQEALDNLDYVEKKLLMLEKSSAEESALLRRIHGAFMRIYEIGWLLRLRPGLELLQAISAYLEYARKVCLTVTPENITCLFNTVDSLEQLFQQRQLQKHDRPLHLPQATHSMYRSVLQWVHQQLEQTESFQKSRLEHTEPQLGTLLIAKGAISRSQLHKTLAHNQNNKPLKEVLVQEGEVSQEQVQEVIDFQKRFSHNTRGAFSIDGPDMVELRNLTGDLSATLHSLQRHLSQSNHQDPLLEHLNAHLETLRATLYHRVKAFSSTPIDELFSRMKRMVKEFARRFEKEVNLELDAPIRQIDRMVADAVNEVLINFLRNAVEHGLESPMERLQANKHPQGLVRLRAYHAEGSLVLSVEDDGRGLDIQALEQEAIAQELIAPGETLDDRKITKLLFEDGLAVNHRNTKPGYGLDKVGRRIREFGGDIQYQSLPSGGSCFTIHLPLPPSYLHGLIVSTHGQYFLLPSSVIRDIIPETEANFQTLPGEETPLLLTEHGPLPIQPLQVQTLGARVHSASSSPKHAFYIVAQGPEGFSALQVEELHEVSMIELSFVGPSFLHDPLVGGGGLHNQDQLVWIVDPMQLGKDKAPLA